MRNDMNVTLFDASGRFIAAWRRHHFPNWLADWLFTQPNENLTCAYRLQIGDRHHLVDPGMPLPVAIFRLLIDIDK